MDYKKIYSDFLTAIENRIENFIPAIEPKSLYEPFKYIMKAGGKRIRPVMTMICCGAVGADPYLAVDAGVALETLHNFTLVHDDIMDDSSLRRGLQTIHKKWDEPTAILTGDVMVGYAFKILPVGVEYPRSVDIFRAFTNELIEVCEGQVFDMNFEKRKSVSMQEYLNMIDKKTARLIETSAVIGGLVGNGSDREVEALRAISHDAGLAFQIQDDLLDMIAEQDKLGKKVGQDIIEGKKTFLIISAMERVQTEVDNKLLSKFFDNHGLDEFEVPLMDDLFTRTGVYDHAKKEIDELFKGAERHFTDLRPNDYSNMLLWLLESIRTRVF